MQAIFDTFSLVGPASDARAAVLFGLAIMLVIMAVAYITSVLFGAGHSGRTGSSNDD